MVTGGTRGLGLAMVRAFASAGAQVVVVSRKPEACDEVVAGLRSEGLKAVACACHVGHWDELEPLVDRVYRDFGRADVLVNNAGISPMYGPYAAAKAGVNAMTVGLAHAFGPTVRVNAVMPGPFLTTISRSWDMDVFAERARTFPMRRAGQSEEIVGAALYLASDASTYTTGSILTVDGGAQWSMAGTGEGAPETELEVNSSPR